MTTDMQGRELPFPLGPPAEPATIQGDPQTAARRRDANAAAHSPSLMLIMMLALLGAVAYAVFLLNPDNRGDLLPYVLVVTAETVLLGLALLAMWTVLSSGYNPRDFAYHQARERLFDAPEILRDGTTDDPTRWRLFLHDKPVDVDIFITTCGEDLDTIAKTVRAAVAVHGKHRTWVLDDGRDDEVRDLAATLGARYIRRLSSGGQKAGNINHALSIAKGQYFVILDADFVPRPELLTETVPFFVRDDVAFVQSPQTYGNMDSLISRGAGYMQAVFYRFVQPGRNRFNAAFCVGTNVVFNRAAIDDIGGMYTDSKSEDVWTSLHLHERGWRSIYIPQTLAVGDTPETIVAYAKQQLRWATGGFEILLQHNPLSPRRKLTMDQRLQYFVTSTHYLSGIAPLLLLLVPPLQIYMDLAPMRLDVSVGTWALYYLGFYGLQIALAFFTLGSFRWEVLLLSAVSWPIYVKALWNALTGKQQAWTVTGRVGGATSPFEVIVPQVLCFVFLLITSVVGVWKHWGDAGLPGLAVAWNITNTVILGGFMVTAVREHLAAIAGQRVARRTTVVEQVVEPAVEPAVKSAVEPAVEQTGEPAPQPGSAAATRRERNRPASRADRRRTPATPGGAA